MLVMLMAIMLAHCIAMKFASVLGWMFTSSRESSVVSLAVNDMMVKSR